MEEEEVSRKGVMPDPVVSRGPLVVLGAGVVEEPGSRVGELGAGVVAGAGVVVGCTEAGVVGSTEEVKRLEVGGLPQMQTQDGAAVVVGAPVLVGPAVVEDSRCGVSDDPAVVAVENIVVVVPDGVVEDSCTGEEVAGPAVVVVPRG